MRTFAQRIFIPVLVLAIFQICVVSRATGIPPELQIPYGFVTDISGILTEDEYEALTDICVDLEESTTCEMAVVIIDTTGDETIEDLAREVFNKWGIGKAETNNGVMILIAIDDRRWRVQTGLGVEDVLDPDLLTDIMDENAVPEFRNSNYGLGLINAAVEISDVLENEFVGDGTDDTE
jgi:uncharacterized protein